MKYVGARYVPKFMGTYDASQSYENMCVVDNGMGTSYISVKPVPPGTPLTDTDYWALYGASSGAIINLQNQIDALKNATERNILVIGNSYVTYGCADALMATFDNAYTKTDDGVGFATYAGHSDTFVTLLNAAIADPDIDCSTITDVIFVSAAGDSRAWMANANTYISNLDTALNTIAAAIASDFPMCKRVSTVLAESRGVVQNVGDSTYKSMFNVHKIFKEHCPKYGVEYLGWTGWNSLLVATDFISDMLHPSAAGVVKIGTATVQAYYGNLTYMEKTDNHICNFNYVSGLTMRVVMRMTPEHVTINCRDVFMTGGQPVTAVANTVLVDMTEMDIPPIAPDPAVEFGVSMININGTIRDNLYVGLQGDSNGCATLKLLATPAVSTTAGGSYVFSEITLISYDIL